MFLEYLFYFRNEMVEFELLQCGVVACIRTTPYKAPNRAYAELTSSAVMICSGDIVFRDSLSHISLACDEMRWMNSAKVTVIQPIQYQ